eukprot:5466790-Prymnesium_polylepis.1
MATPKGKPHIRKKAVRGERRAQGAAAGAGEALSGGRRREGGLEESAAGPVDSSSAELRARGLDSAARA